MDQQFSGEGPTDNEVSAEECLTDNEEMKKAENISSIYGIKVKEYSSFNKLIRKTAWANSFVNNLKSKIKNKYIDKKTISRRSGWEGQTETLVNSTSNQMKIESYFVTED